jgi:hypothetical protein
MQTRKHDPAFPIFDSDGLINIENDGDQGGLSKREYFAAMALQGILSNPEFMATMAASVAVKKADELIYLLNQTDSEK